MSQFQRRVSLGVGLVLFAVFGLAIAAELLSNGGLESDAFSAADVIAGVLVLLGSTAFIVAGVREEFRLAGRPLEWWQSMSAGFVLLGLAFAIPALSQLPSSGVLNTFGGGLMVLSGYAQLRRGPPTENDDSELSMREVAMIVVGGMVVVFAILFAQLIFTFG